MSDQGRRFGRSIYHRLVPWKVHVWLRRTFFCPRHRHEFRTWLDNGSQQCTFCRLQIPVEAPEVARQRNARRRK